MRSRAGAGLEKGCNLEKYRAWWASTQVPGNPPYAGAATEAILPGVVPGLVGMLWVEGFFLYLPVLGWCVRGLS